MSYVYVITTESKDTVKIGYSKEPDVRLKNLQVGNHQLLELYHLEKMDKLTPRTFERLAHKYLRHKRISGEWFKMDPIEAKEMLEWIAIRWSEHEDATFALKQGLL